MPRPYAIKRSLYAPVIWMGMERVPGAIWILSCGVLILMGFMYAKAYVMTLALVCLGAVGMVGLRKLADYDPFFFPVIWRRKDYQDIYPAFVSQKERRDG